MFKIGCHLSSSKGFLAMGKEAVSIGANTFQFFTRNPRGGSAKPLDLDDVKNYISFTKENGIQAIVAHAPYTLNACSKDASIRKFALDVFSDDIERLEHIPGSLYNFHPGSHVEQGVEVGIKYIVELLDKVIKEKMQTTILLETMAGKGSEIGRSFDELNEIINKVELNDKLGVCLDTCHVYDAGYDIVNDLDGVLKEFDKKIGLKRLRAIHINDSMNPFASHKDRHQKIGQGSIPLDTFSKIINHPSLKDLIFILETPNEIDGYKKEIALLKSLYK